MQGPDHPSGKVKYNVLSIGLLTFTIVLGGFSVGYNCGIIAGANLYIDKVFPESVTLADKSNIVSIAVLGATFGAIIAGTIAENIGRKKSIILSASLSTAGPIIQYFASTVSFLCFGRAVLGIGMGISMMVSQVYLSESSPIPLRGQVVPSYFFGLFFGFIIAHTVSIAIAYQLSVMFGLGALPNILELILMIATQKESPSYLAQTGRLQEAISVTQLYYDKQELTIDGPTKDECSKHIYEAELASKAEKISQLHAYMELLTKYRWNLFVGIMLHVIQQFTGINIILQFGPTILKDAGMGGDEPRDLLLCCILLSTINAIGNFLGLVLSGKHGRRELMIKCTFPMGVSLIVMAGAMIVNITFGSPSISLLTGWVCIASLSAYLILFTIGFASQPWTVCSEIFPAHLRGIANSITATTNWLFNYLLSAVFLVITSTDTGKIFSYTILGLSCFYGYYFTNRYVPETKDHPLVECVSLVLQCRTQHASKPPRVEDTANQLQERMTV